MKILYYELHKLVKTPALLGFLALCLAVNIWAVLVSSHRDEIEILNGMAQVTGPRYGEAYESGFTRIAKPANPHSTEFWLYENTEAAMLNARHGGVYGELLENPRLVEELLLEHSNKTPPPALQLLLRKFEVYRTEMQKIIQSGEHMDVYFATQSYEIHYDVFSMLGRLFAFESALLMALLMLWTLGYEQMAGTRLLALATKTGRRLALRQAVAALLAGTACFAVIFAVGYGLCFAVNDFSQVWGQHLSTQNLITYLAKRLGPLPWMSRLTVGQYFAGFVGVSWLNCLGLALLAVPFGLLMKNVYVGFGSLAGLAGLQALLDFLGNQAAVTPFYWYLNFIPPTAQIANNEFWFSTGEDIMLLRHFEWLYPLIFIALLCPVLALCANRFKHKEIH